MVLGDSSALIGAMSSVIRGVRASNCYTKPQNDLTSVLLVGQGKELMAWTRLGLAV